MGGGIAQSSSSGEGQALSHSVLCWSVARPFVELLSLLSSVCA